MSGFLAGKVWQSALSAELKPLAAALADIANDDGTSIYPSVPYVSWLIGWSERSIYRGLGKLRKNGILRVVEPGGGKRPDGTPATTEYRMIEEQLPQRPPWRISRREKFGRTRKPQKAPPRSEIIARELATGASPH